jgi:8-oxo-dGTP diphosphatase
VRTVPGARTRKTRPDNDCQDDTFAQSRISSYENVSISRWKRVARFVTVGSLVKKQIDVVGAVIRRDGLILCAQRGPSGSLPGMWEFPGGKIEPGETPRQALEREIVEELDCRVSVGKQVASTSYMYDFGTVKLTTFYCELLEGIPILLEHESVVWLAPSALRTLDWAPADIPAVDAIVENPPPHE